MGLNLFYGPAGSRTQDSDRHFSRESATGENPFVRVQKIHRRAVFNPISEKRRHDTCSSYHATDNGVHYACVCFQLSSTSGNGWARLAAVVQPEARRGPRVRTFPRWVFV